MVILYHSNNRVVSVVSELDGIVPFDKSATIAAALVNLAQQFPDSILLWCHQSLQAHLNVSEIEDLFHHKKLLLSFNPSESPFIDSAIGYADASLFVPISKMVSFPSWQMSSVVGGVSAEVLLALNAAIPLKDNFDYFLCSLAKLAMPRGLLCYSEPLLLKPNSLSIPSKGSLYTLFRFVKQHYKTRWVFLLVFNLFLYERKLPILPFLFSLFYKNRTKIAIHLDGIIVQSSKKVIGKATVDVIIPTIGRKTYLYDVLKDFSKQTLLPNKIVIVEQNPEAGSKTELDYIQNEKWPFEIQHIFTHQAGACNARNLALNETKSEWVFLADDDNRFESTLLAAIFDKIKQFGNQVVTTSYPQKNEIKKYNNLIQWPTFGAGNSVIKRVLLEKVRFNNAFEFGYGEDSDFGMQLRNQGNDVLYLPEPEILHLKAPMGGFRTKPVLQWQKDAVQPKPSPTIMLFQLLHCTTEQTNSYKTILFLQYYRLQSITNPIRYYSHFKKQWDRSVFWANQLKQQNEV
ncbi:glycosyltransferase family 2 protein [Flavobacterium nackdongense]|uniref:Glycosyltransferase family 2 protein n=1 Tax=Flavobacterium nackdongense TaxID=2547394 RepID=A0A4P6Y9X7_9FLAO|nr:glycosyltransferase family A protein [Flavobacterium nackdongense]QBN19881.1 glycosyltransferase family 2 protein [Flavobacterium nackdongense]